jgi:hypothetical protein
VDAIDGHQVTGTCRHDGKRLIEHAQAGACPRGFYKAALAEEMLLQQGYGPSDPRFPGASPCCGK